MAVRAHGDQRDFLLLAVLKNGSSGRPLSEDWADIEALDSATLGYMI